MKNHHIILIGLGTLALLMVYKKRSGATTGGAADYTAQQNTADPAWWNFAGSWQV